MKPEVAKSERRFGQSQHDLCVLAYHGLEDVFHVSAFEPFSARL
jgi:hypothetical protein